MPVAQKCSEGNTISSEPKTKKSRFFCFTSFNIDRPVWDPDMVKYAMWGKETCPKTQRIHYQCFVYFFNPISLKNAINKIKLMHPYDDYKPCHIEPCFGSIEDNEEYCSKEGSYEIFGTKPQQGRRNDLDAVAADILNNNINVEDVLIDNPMMYHQYGRTLEKLEDIKLSKFTRKEWCYGIWIYGESGCGKTRLINEITENESVYNYKKDSSNDWWDNYSHQKYIICDDYRGEITFSEILKICDVHGLAQVSRRNKRPINVASEKIYFTSSLHPNDVYKHSLHENDRMKQFYRRILVIKLECDTLFIENIPEWFNILSYQELLTNNKDINIQVDLSKSKRWSSNDDEYPNVFL